MFDFSNKSLTNLSLGFANHFLLTLAVSALLFLCPFSNAYSAKKKSSDQKIEFRMKGDLVDSLSLKELVKKVKTKEQKLIEPHEEVEKTYKGFEPKVLLNSIYGDRWQKFDKLIVKALDGFRTEIEIKRFHEKKGLFAYGEVGEKRFVIEKQNKKVPVGPLYLTWYGYKDAQGRFMDRHMKWPYQIYFMDLK